MEEKIIINRKLVKAWIIEVISIETLSITIQKTIKYKGNVMTLKDIIDNSIIVGSVILVIVLLLTYAWFRYIQLVGTLKFLHVKTKVYDVMFQKFRMNQPNHLYGFDNTDIKLFSEEEQKIANQYFYSLELLEGKIMVRDKKQENKANETTSVDKNNFC